ncbi:hypothetical protein F2Q68_00002480 [Brassica cretica]|uniref:NAC domain-containing protein n=1 Tax=Brassica cretica TaxID=69181 RepID=A0A8S9JFY1_BRACR|nr:hypothetical protein F2Q68_00002480 [Brassica cretica]
MNNVRTSDQKKWAPFITGPALIVPVVTLGSISKGWTVPGWRTGWLALDDLDGVFRTTKIFDAAKQFLEINYKPPTVIQPSNPSFVFLFPLISETPRISRACFCPTHADLVNILRKRIDRGERSSLITDNHILYKTAPWLFQHVRHVSFYEKYVWYYYVTRKQPPAMTRKADSSRPCRKVGGSGTWKTSGLKKVIDKKGVRVGSMHYASFQANVETKKDGIETGWVMHEFLLDRPGFQELVLCRIKFRPGKDNAQYAPIFAPIVIGQPQPPPVETHQDPGTEHQGIMGQDSNYPLLNEDMGEYGQDFGDLVDNQCHYLVQETMDRLQIPMMMNQALNEEQEWNGYSSPSLAQQYFGQDMVPMTQHLDAQHQHFGSMDEHQGLGDDPKEVKARLKAWAHAVAFVSTTHHHQPPNSL